MKSVKFITIAAAAAVALTGCSKQATPEEVAAADKQTAQQLQNTPTSSVPDSKANTLTEFVTFAGTRTLFCDTGETITNSTSTASSGFPVASSPAAIALANKCKTAGLNPKFQPN